MVIFGSTKSNQKWLVYLGDILGTSILVISSLVLAIILGFVPEDWMLGLLGIIPVLMGVKLLLFGENDDDDAVENGMKKQSSVVLNVALITVATCGADNIGIYVPIFVQSNLTSLIIILITFFFMLTIFCYIGNLLVRIPKVADLLEKWGRYITAIVYIFIGTGILLESGTFAHFLG
ncbi:cadmium binding protein [Companilactobacillus nodensis DSM 19682 = JCM 14932 = NBRC 107160]|uniref:Cadmium binding protein n=2 Tax=Companilactobacillus nodensis TaxID=460870 RepID=A0A0R1KDC7_9LACO|nr:cadmium binding protein [Companilactobacillus nodensis DSM 19682 = JCM 14932 = NBRC 107160]